MPTSTTNRFGVRIVARLALVSASVVAIVVGLPALLVAASLQRFDAASPLRGMKSPWQWSLGDLRSWGRSLTDGLDSSAALVDLFLRLALVLGWICAGVLVYTVIDEMVFQLRHRMPSARHRRLGGVGLLGRKLATILVAVLPLAITATPALAGPQAARSAAGVVHQRVADLETPPATVLILPTVDAPIVASALGSGWTVVEVQRGDSVWAIAERVADGRDVAVVAKQIVTANLGTVMSDGHRFSTPALIEPGWLLNVPVPAIAVPGGAASVDAALPADPQLGALSVEDSYVVVAGDSYWQIAEDHLDPSAGASEVAAFTRDLMRVNAPLFGYADQRLIRPGDIVLLGVPEPSPSLPLPTVEAVPVAVLPVLVDPLPPVVVDVPTSVVALPTVGALPPVVTIPPLPASSATPAPTSVESFASTIVDDWSSNGIPIKQGLAAAVLLSGGALVVLDARRRQQLRSAHVGARLLPPTEEAVATETLLRSLSPADQLARIDLALRCAAPDLARQQARALAIEVSDDGEIRLYTDRPTAHVADRWMLDLDAGAWRLPAAVSLGDLAEGGRRANQPCPAIVHLGESAGGQLFVDLEAVGLLSIDATPDVAASIVRCVAASLAVSPFVESTRVFTVGLEIEAHLGNPTIESHELLNDAVDAVRATVGSIAAATSGSATTFALRVAGNGGEAWEPALLLAIGASDPQDLALLAALAGGGGRGVGVMIDQPVVGSGVVLRATEGDFVLEPLGRRVTPVGLSQAEVTAVDNLLDASVRPLLAGQRDTVGAVSIFTEFDEREHSLVVEVMGEVSVRSASGDLVGFDRSKAQELVVWLSQHRHRPTRSSARTALWDIAVRDATFSNVVSDARRAMAKVVTPPPGQEWLGRTMNEDLPLHDLVVSDAELLVDRVAAARGLDARGAIAVLRPGVESIHGMPFAGTSYLWPDAEGITSSLVLLATSAAAELAGHYLAVGDIDGVFWATGQGLKVLAGHEELIAMRMRAHAHRGDLAGVRSEWDTYERAIHADTWAAAEPSPKLIDLRRELLSPSLAS
jgi:nucleoid-associated protein YgaU